MVACDDFRCGELRWRHVFCGWLPIPTKYKTLTRQKDSNNIQYSEGTGTMSRIQPVVACTTRCVTLCNRHVYRRTDRNSSHIITENSWKGVKTWLTKKNSSSDQTTSSVHAALFLNRWTDELKDTQYSTVLINEAVGSRFYTRRRVDLPAIIDQAIFHNKTWRRY